MKHLCVYALSVVVLAGGTSSASPPWRTTNLLQNNFGVLSAHDSVLIAAGDNAVATLVFDGTTKQFLPSAYDQYSGPPVRIKRQGQVAVIQSAAGSLTFYAAAALPSLVLLGEVYLTFDYLDFAMAGNQLFFARGFDGVRQYELSSYSDLIFVDSSLAPVHPVAVTFEQDRLYVVDDYTGVFVFDPSPTALGSPSAELPLTTPATSIAISGDTAFVGLNDGGILVTSLQADSLVVLDTLRSLFTSGRLELADTLLLNISPDGRQSEVLSLRGRHNPLLPDSATTFLGGSVFDNVGRAFFVTPALSGEINLYDLDNIETDLSQPRPANPYGGEVTDVCLFNERVIVSRKAHPTLSHEIQTANPSLHPLPVMPGLGGIDQLEIVRDRLLMYSHLQQTVAFVTASGAKFQLAGIEGPFADDIHRFRVTASLFDTLNLMCLFGDVTVDISIINPSWHTTPFARLYFPERPIDVAVSDTFIIVGTAESAYLYSINSNLVMTYRSTIGLSGAGPVIGPLVRIVTDRPSGSSALWVVRTDGIEQYNIANPTLPLLSAQLPVAESIADASRGGDYIYASSSSAGLLRIFSCATSTPILTDSIRLMGNVIDNSGTSVALASPHAVWLVEWDAPSFVGDNSDISMPVSFDLRQNYPNPFNPTSTIEYTLTNPSLINLTVYNILGQPVRQLANHRAGAGKHEIVFDAAELSSGVYFYRLTTETGIKSKKMVVVK